MPPTLTRDLEAKIESRKTQIRSLQRDLQSTQDSLNSWDEVSLTSIQGVCFDEGVATSPSSVSRVTEPAISHFPQAGGDPELFPRREHAMPEAVPMLAAAPSTPLTRISTTPVAVHHSSVPTTSSPNGGTEATVSIPGYGGPTKRGTEAIAESPAGLGLVFILDSIFPCFGKRRKISFS